MTDDSTTPATSPTCCWESQFAGKSLPRPLSATIHRDGPMSSATIVSIGDSVSIKTSDMMKSRTLRELHRHHAEQALDQVEVRDGPAHDLSGLQVVLLRAVEAFQ